MAEQTRQLNITDMSKGLVTNIGALSLGPNQTPDSLNVFAYNGEMLFRGGFEEFASLTASADACATYYDVSQVKHMLVWEGGDIVDVASGTAVNVATAVYNAGEQIAHAQLNDTLYWATLSVPLRQYDGTTEGAVANSGGVGTVPPPSCNFLLAYAGSLVAVAPVSVGVPLLGSFMWSNVNDPTTWLGASVQGVGSNDGSTCTFALLMGISPGNVANPGVPSTRQLLVGKSEGTLFLYQGALGTLTENAVPCPAGSIDANSPVYIPTPEGQGAVMFLGSDGQFWLTNGNQAVIASKDIQNFVYGLTQNALILNPDQRFFATYNQRYQYYMCDFGNGFQLVYKWDTQAWWLFSGWPSGPYMIAADDNGLPSVFVAASQPGITNGVYKLAVEDVDDNGADIVAYYTSPYIHGGKPERQKQFINFTLFTYDRGTQYTVTAHGMPNSSGDTQETIPLVFNDPTYGNVVVSADGIWDQSEWDQATWGGGIPTNPQPYDPVAMRGRLTVPSTGSQWVPANQPGPLKSGAAQIKIEWTGGLPSFRVLGFSIGFQYRGIGFVGNLPGQAEGNQNSTAPNKFTNVGDS